jgi:c-di-AMP phosphodiesterase-like protein
MSRFSSVLDRILLALIAVAVIRIIVAVVERDWRNASVGVIVTALVIMVRFWTVRINRATERRRLESNEATTNGSVPRNRCMHPR